MSGFPRVAIMKLSAIYLLMVLYCNNSFCQTIVISKDEIHYTAKILYMEVEDTLLQTLSSKPFGKDVHIWVDTIFKKYTIFYTDEDNKEIAIVLKFIRNYFGKDHDPDYKIYLMEYQGRKFRVDDFLDHPLIQSLAINDELPIQSSRGSAYMVLRIKNATLQPRDSK